MPRKTAMAESVPLERGEVLARTAHRDLVGGTWWRTLRAWRDVPPETFNDHRWQLRNSVTDVAGLAKLVHGAVPRKFLADVEEGLRLAPMALRITPYVLSLIDWSDPVADPLRRQFLPIGSEHEPDHAMGTLDALEEQRDAVAEGLTHRYPDKVLFLALDVCPVYCRYCTRSYSIGSTTDEVRKVDFRASTDRWDAAFRYIEDTDSVEDVVVSGGDLSLLGAGRLKLIGDRLLAIPHVRRIRIATKALAVLPQKILSDMPWTDAIGAMADQGRRRGVQVCVHTHFNHPTEITAVARDACDALWQRGVVLRNQSVLLRGVNDDVDTMTTLVRRLAWVNVQPYYVYVHDMVPGVETLRTSLAVASAVEKGVRGQTAGFMTPTFVCDAYGGGGKRDLHSYEHYDEDRGVAVYRSPVVDPARPFFYFDPLRHVSAGVRKAWQAPLLRDAMIARATAEAGF